MDSLRALTRRKVLDENVFTKTNLARVLNIFDLTALGVSSTLGVGIYVLAGHIAKDIAGPAIVLSFIIAAIASVLAGLCYAEFGARVPRAGSAYVYTYVCVGEFAAFIIGWNMILEYIIGSASVARSLSIYVDSLLNMTLQENFRIVAPINVTFMSDYFDFFSFGLCFLFAVGLGVGMKESSLINNICTAVNLSVVLFVIIGGSTAADIKNWSLPPPKKSHSNYGVGGFFPYGIKGMIQGAAVCFYGFIGFDCIATTGEEVKNPQRAIPMSIITSLFIIFLSYFGVSAVITLMIPYYLQSDDSPIPHAFALIHWDWAKWILTVGAVCGLVTSLFGSMFPLPRIIYAMAQDGLIFKFLGKVSERFHTPLTGTILSGILTGLMAALFKLEQLINMMSIATLLAYTIVSASVLLLRYSKTEADAEILVARKTSEIHEYTPISDNKIDIWYSHKTESTTTREEDRIIFQLFNSNGLDAPTPRSEAIVTLLVSCYSALSLILGLSITHLYDKILQIHTWSLNWILALVLLMGLVLISISKQPASKKTSSFKVPFVPLVPALSITINIFLMLMLDNHTWIRLCAWMIIGLFIYGFYGFWNSILRYNQYERIE